MGFVLIFTAFYAHPYLKLDPFVLSEDGLDLEVYADGGDEGRGEGVIGVPEEETGLAHGAVSCSRQPQNIVNWHWPDI